MAAVLGGLGTGGLTGCAGLGKGGSTPRAEPFFLTRGAVLVVKDMQTYDWPVLAKEAGLTTLATHFAPSEIAAFVKTDAGQRFLEGCRLQGIAVEHELHAQGDLLPAGRHRGDDQPEFLYRRGEFPSARETDLPMSDQARRYYKSGPPFLQRYLPFWMAVLADRLLILLIPLVAVALPLARLLPALYAWRARSKIYRLYGELCFLDYAIVHNFDAARALDYAARLDSIEQAAERRRIPLAFTNELYILREHIGLVRQRLESKVAAGK